MTANGSWKRWFGRWSRQRSRRAGNDFADYGTAFGLELSLQYTSDQQENKPEMSTALAESAKATPPH